MNTLLLFFALPIATIILSIVLERILRCPILVAGTVFAIFLIVTFAAFDASFLIFAIVYTAISFITASIVHFICRCMNENWRNNNSSCLCGSDSSRNSDSSCLCGLDTGRNNNSSCSCGSDSGRNNDSSCSCGSNSGRNNSCGSNNTSVVNANITTTSNNNTGEFTGTFCGCRRNR